MKNFLKIFILAFVLVITSQNAFAKDYVYYRPQVENDIFMEYMNLANSDFQGKKGNSRFKEYNVLCIAPEVDGNVLKTNFRAYHPFTSLMYTNPPHYSDDAYRKFLEKISMNFQYLPGSVNGVSKNILNVKNFVLSDFLLKDYNACSIDLDTESEVRELIEKSIKSRDSFEFVFQYPVGTKFSARFLSPLLPTENFEIKTNLASYSDKHKNFGFFPTFLCFRGDTCDIDRAEVTLLDGKKIDFTKEAQDFKQKSEPFSLVERSYINLPSNTKSLKVWYK